MSSRALGDVTGCHMPYIVSFFLVRLVLFVHSHAKLGVHSPPSLGDLFIVRVNTEVYRCFMTRGNVEEYFSRSVTTIASSLDPSTIDEFIFTHMEFLLISLVS